MLKVEFKISTISIPRKAWFCDPSLYHFLQKAPIWGKLGPFLAKFPKIHPILQIGRIGYVTITHPSNTKTYENAPQNLWASLYTIYQWEPLPPGVGSHKMTTDGVFILLKKTDFNTILPCLGCKVYRWWGS